MALCSGCGKTLGPKSCGGKQEAVGHSQSMLNISFNFFFLLKKIPFLVFTKKRTFS